MNQEELEKQIEYCNKQLKKLDFQISSISKYKEFLEKELQKINETKDFLKRSSYESLMDICKTHKNELDNKLKELVKENWRNERID